MTIQLEDIAPQLKAEKEQRESQKLEELRHTVGVGTAVATITGDSKWAIYLNHMNSLIESAERQVRGYEQSLSNGDFLGGQAYGQAKVKLSDSRGLLKGLKQSTDLLTILINQGEKAAQEIYELTKQGIS
ncbi:hypothetical protein LCGC14_2936790 [marine sediment metagenome]|uniref:Uncharacterized protein n=1 Tax=marine sediment metagenome TaxID=412755 RepID=A0A0F8XJ55_9ZZZZ